MQLCLPVCDNVFLGKKIVHAQLIILHGNIFFSSLSLGDKPPERSNENLFAKHFADRTSTERFKIVRLENIQLGPLTYFWVNDLLLPAISHNLAC